MEHLDGRIIILILFVVFSAIRWFFEKVKRGDQPHDVSESLEDIYENFREEIRQRQTTVQQEAPSQAQAPPPLPQTPPPRQAVPKPVEVYQPQKVTQPKLSAEEKAALARLQKQSTPQRKRVAGARTSIRDLLASPHSTRQAIILHEILGEPKSMQKT